MLTCIKISLSYLALEIFCLGAITELVFHGPSFERLVSRKTGQPGLLGSAMMKYIESSRRF